MRLCELLDDRQWHPLEGIIREVGKVIPPGTAVRKAEHDRKTQPGSPEQRQIQREAHRLVESGKRQLIREKLGERYWELDVVEEVQCVRMVELPERVRYERARRLAARLLGGDLTELVEADPGLVLRQLTYDQLLQVSVELASRERERVLAARSKMVHLGEQERSRHRGTDR